MLRLIRQNKVNLAIGIIASLVAALAWFIVQQGFQTALGLTINRTEGLLIVIFACFLSFVAVGLPLMMSRRPRMWIAREEIHPSFRKRIAEAREEVFLVGVALDTVLQNYLEEFVTALETQSNLRLRILMLNPDSLHAQAHQEFASYDVAAAIKGTINGPLRALHHRLSDHARRRLDARLTSYLPRFSCRVVDATMLINFYLFNRRAQANPSVEFHRSKHASEFSCIYNGINELFAYDGSGSASKPTHPNLKIVSDGKWLGFPANTAMGRTPIK